MQTEDYRRFVETARRTAAHHIQVVGYDLHVDLRGSRKKPFAVLDCTVREVFRSKQDLLSSGDKLSIKFDPFGGIVDIAAILGNLTLAKCLEAFVDDNFEVLNGQIKGLGRLTGDPQMLDDLSDLTMEARELPSRVILDGVEIKQYFTPQFPYQCKGPPYNNPLNQTDL